MKNMDNYRWIIPSLIALGVILLSGGIFVGVKSYETLEANSTKVDNTTQKNLSSKQKFKLDEYCQIWLQDDNEIPVMLGKVNEDLLKENEDGYISVFKYNKEGKKELVEKTSIQIKSLPKSVQEELKDAIVLDNEDDAYSRLEDFGS